MVRSIARWWARWVYVWRKEEEGALHEWSAGVAARNSDMTKALVAKLTAEADAFDARIKEVGEIEEKGYWLCEGGHENAIDGECSDVNEHLCPDCSKPAKLIKRSEMSGQERYESDKERKEAEQIAANKRKEIAEQEENLKDQEATVKHFRIQSASSRKLARSVAKSVIPKSARTVERRHKH